MTVRTYIITVNGEEVDRKPVNIEKEPRVITGIEALIAAHDLALQSPSKTVAVVVVVGEGPSGEGHPLDRI